MLRQLESMRKNGKEKKHKRYPRGKRSKKRKESGLVKTEIPNEIILPFAIRVLNSLLREFVVEVKVDPEWFQDKTFKTPKSIEDGSTIHLGKSEYEVKE